MLQEERSKKSLLQNASDRWRDHLQGLAPSGADVNKRNGVGDAFRHYMSYGTLSHFAGPSFARLVGIAGESGAGNPEHEKGMDLGNNELGIIEGPKVSSEYELAIMFRIDASNGKVQVIADAKDGKGRPTTRPTDARDVGGYHGAPIDKDHQTHDSRPNDMSGRDDGTMIA